MIFEMIARPHSVAFIALWLYFHKQAFLVPDSIKLRVDKQGAPYLVTLVTVFFRGTATVTIMFLCQVQIKLGCTEQTRKRLVYRSVIY